MTAPLELESTLTDRYQTTVPETVRRTLKLGKRDKIHYTTLGSMTRTRSALTKAAMMLIGSFARCWKAGSPRTIGIGSSPRPAPNLIACKNSLHRLQRRSPEISMCYGCDVARKSNRKTPCGSFAGTRYALSCMVMHFSSERRAFSG